MKNAVNTTSPTIAERLSRAAALMATVSLAHDLYNYNPQNYQEKVNAVAETARYASELVAQVVAELPDESVRDKKHC